MAIIILSICVTILLFACAVVVGKAIANALNKSLGVRAEDLYNKMVEKNENRIVL